MSKTYEECCKEVNLDLKNPPPALKTEWIAYVGGEVITCKSMNEAIATSSLYEKVTSVESMLSHEKYFQDREIKKLDALTLFKKYLRQEYLFLENRVYNICYEDAEFGFSSEEPDLIASRLDRNVNLYKRFNRKN